MALLGNTALVGAVNADNSPGDGAGAAYVFARNGTVWTQQAKLQAPTGNPARFGSSVSLQPDMALVGAPVDSPGGVSSGSAYAFVRSGNTWSQQAELTEQNGADQDSFGQAVALGASTALVGSPGYQTAAGSKAGAAFTYVQSASSWVPDSQLDAGVAHEYAAFGTSVAVQGDTAVIGAEQEGELPTGNGVGGVYIFSRSGTDWQQTAHLSPDDGYFFGDAVSIDGDTIVVGSRDRDQGSITSAGGAYVYVGGGANWAKQSVLTATDAADNDHAGTSVSVNGDTALVGAPDASASSGAAYVFVRAGTSWSQQAKLVASDAAQGDQFGGAVSLSSDTAVVGATGHATAAGAGAGSAYVFVRNGTSWTEQAELAASDAGSNDQFGSAVYVSGDTAIVGAPFHDSSTSAFNTGRAYVFVRSGTTWTQQAELEASDAATDARFGSSVSLEGTMALIGAENVQPSGEAYVFSGSGSTWTERAHFEASGLQAFASFGNAVSLDQGTALIGAYLADVKSPDWGTVSVGVGAAYVYRIAQCSTGADCTTGFCVDGVCCDTACGGGATNDCQACSVGFGAQVNGVCGPIAASAAHVCRPAAGPCDAPEVCDGASTSCPTDAFAPATTACRAPGCAAGVETLAASCTGSSADCPAAQTQSCGDYACGPNACRTTCATDADCASGRVCNSAGSCVSAGTGGAGGTSGGSGGTSGGGSSGTSGSAGVGASTSGGAGPVDGGAGAPSGSGAGSKGGCGCELPSRHHSHGVWILMALVFGVGLRRSGSERRKQFEDSRS